MGDPNYKRSTGGKNWRHKNWYPAMVVNGEALMHFGDKYKVTPKGWRKIKSETK